MSSMITENLVFSAASRSFISSLRASGRAGSTLSSYSSKLNLIRTIIGDVQLSLITDDALNRAIALLEKGYFARKPRSGASMNQIRSIIRTFFFWAMETRRITVNPAANLRLGRTGHLRTQPISTKELSVLFRTMKRDDSYIARRDETLFGLYAFAGLRRNEALTLRTTDLDLRKNRIWLSDTKINGAGFRIISKTLRTMLMNFLRNKMRNEEFCSLFLFPGNCASKHLCPRAAQNRFEYWKRSAGLRPILTLRSFRSGFASRLYSASRDAVLVASALGHKHLASVTRYIILSEESIRSGLDKAFG